MDFKFGLHFHDYRDKNILKKGSVGDQYQLPGTSRCKCEWYTSLRRFEDELRKPGIVGNVVLGQPQALSPPSTTGHTPNHSANKPIHCQATRRSPHQLTAQSITRNTNKSRDSHVLQQPST